MAPARIIKQEPGEKHFFSRFRPVCIRCRKTFSISALEIVQVAASVQCVTVRIINRKCEGLAFSISALEIVRVTASKR
ncbi:hypothetical protein BHE74_00058641 [Ensete ventricosum]|nr:hypothetical protein BHE74_00058641 [Ensete ventricosum]RZS19623.1 hypothetical protein BHM03_00052040 [Ensete ventricosum]